MSPVPFYKMSGSGNDFIMLDGRIEAPSRWPADRTRAICDRRLGVGADGLVILSPEGAGQVRMTFFNCDGSLASMCGNAALCSTRLAGRLELAPPGEIELLTGAGSFPVRCLDPDSIAALNLPDFDVPKPLKGIRLAPGEMEISLATVGVPHLIVLVEDLDRVDLTHRGRELRFDPLAGPAGANVNFVGSRPNNDGAWPVRTYERGVEGETLACGTGAVAVGDRKSVV